MRSFGVTHLLMFAAFVVLALDSRRLNPLARLNGRGRRMFTSGHGIPAGANPDQVGLPLRQIQMRVHVDWQDGGLGWDGPEILPIDEPDLVVVVEDDPIPLSPPELISALPVLWTPFPALPAAGATGDWLAESKVA